MRRVAFALLVAAAFGALTTQRASAIVEFCPARLSFAPVRVASNAQGASLYGIQLFAEKPRVVSATLAFDTSAGWFTASLPRLQLRESDLRYSQIGGASPGTWLERSWSSAVLYVRFASSVGIKYAWVLEANSVACDPLPPAANVPPDPDARVQLVSGDDLTAAPAQNAETIAAQPATSLESSSCTAPFANLAMISKPWFGGAQITSRPGASSIRPQRPPGVMFGFPNPGIGVSVVEVAVNSDGSVADAWAKETPPQHQLDAAVLRFATHGKYQAGRAYCKNVPGIYLFRVTFPN